MGSEILRGYDVWYTSGGHLELWARDAVHARDLAMRTWHEGKFFGNITRVLLHVQRNVPFPTSVPPTDRRPVRS